MNYKATILVADDERSLREILRFSLEIIGYRVILAENGEEGLAVFSKNPHDIDIVLSDVNMPVMDGIDMVCLINNIDPSVEIILMTGDIQQQKVLQCKHGSFPMTILEKPFSVATIDSVMKDALNRRKYKSSTV